ncbi:MAG TPA: nucleotidyltransferase family protein, partial [Candidatus Synoicihabitans sp.]|nr:nucleotidyltransferase family protein [Candidatus Synoicihabitans sp.]
MKALILAGGQGQRLRPYTTVVPKPLMPLGDKPVLEVLLRQLHAHGIREVVIAVNHLRELIEAFFNDGRALGLKITYSVEDEPLGTAGPIGAVLDELGNDFLVLNGDLLTTLDFARLITAHETSRAAATVAIYRQQLRLDYGIITRDGDNRLTDYVEKPM